MGIGGNWTRTIHTKERTMTGTWLRFFRTMNDLLPTKSFQCQVKCVNNLSWFVTLELASNDCRRLRSLEPTHFLIYVWDKLSNLIWTEKYGWGASMIQVVWRKTMQIPVFSIWQEAELNKGEICFCRLQPATLTMSNNKWTNYMK